MNKNIIIVIMLIVTAFAAGRFLTPKKVEIKEVEKVVYKEQEVKYKDRTIVEIINKDGSKTITTKETEKSTKNVVLNKETEKENNTTYASNNWSIHGLIGASTSSVSDARYGLHISKRLIGPIYTGVWAITNKSLNDITAGVSVGLTF